MAVLTSFPMSAVSDLLPKNSGENEVEAREIGGGGVRTQNLSGGGGGSFSDGLASPKAVPVLD